MQYTENSYIRIKKPMYYGENGEMNDDFRNHCTTSKKVLIEDFCMSHTRIYSPGEVCSTRTTGRRMEEATNLHVRKFFAGSIGENKQFMEMVERQDLDMVILFYNPVMMDPKNLIFRL